MKGQETKREFEELELVHNRDTVAVVDEFKKEFWGIPGNDIMHKSMELQVYYELARGLHNTQDETGDIIHCGVLRGGSLCLMALGVKHSHFPHSHDQIIAIDSYSDWDDTINLKNLPIALNNVRRFKVGNKIFLVITHSHLYFEKFFKPSSARLVFLDTVHNFEQTEKEIALSVPFLIDGGWLVVHDYTDKYPGTLKAVNGFIDSFTDTISICSAGESTICIQVHNG